MKPHRVVLAFSTGVVGLALLAPITALAAGGHGGHGGGPMVSGARPAAPFPNSPSGSPQGGVHPGRPLRFHHNFQPFVCCQGATVWGFPRYYGGPAYYLPPSYYDPTYASAPAYPAPAYSTPSVYGSISLAPTPQALPDVIEYPNGRYELRGDGLTAPYIWVWVPKPPPPPPAPAAPPPAPPSPPEPSSSRDSLPSRPVQVYRWTDEQGGVHWTDRLEVVPTRYRQQAKQTPPM